MASTSFCGACIRLHGQGCREDQLLSTLQFFPLLDSNVWPRKLTNNYHYH